MDLASVQLVIPYVYTPTDACLEGDLEAVKFYFNRMKSSRLTLGDRGYHKCSTKLMNLIARNGHLAVLKWLYKNTHSRCDHRMILCWVAMTGHLDVFAWLYKKGAHCSQFILNLAAEHGHLHILKWSLEHLLEFSLEEIMHVALVRNQVEILEWCHQMEPNLGCPICDMYLRFATRSNSQESIEWFLRNKLPKQLRSDEESKKASCCIVC